MLADRAEHFCRDFLPGGVKDSGRWRCGDVYGNRGQSVSILLTGPKQGKWRDFAAGEGGDMIDLLAKNQNTDKSGAYKAACSWLGISEETWKPSERRHSEARLKAKHDARERQSAKEDREKARYAREIFQAARRADGTMVEAYLRCRGITIPVPAALRLYPLLAHVPTSKALEKNFTLPCMVGAMWAPTNEPERPFEITALHRTWLTLADHGGTGTAERLQFDHRVMEIGADAKVERYKFTAPGQKRDTGKMVRGRATGAFIPLTPGPTRSVLALTEGIENGLSVAQVNPTWSAWAAYSVSNFANLVIPQSVRRLVLCADNDSGFQKDAAGNVMRDAAGEPIVPADKAINKAARLLAAIAADAGRQLAVEIAWPAAGKDFNDMLREGTL
jgi:hypothetical protein